MAIPSRYVQSYDFSSFQVDLPSTPLPAVQVDIQFADIQTSTTELRDALGDIRRSDGGLVNGIVTADSLSGSLSIGFTNEGTWAEATMYDAGDGVAYGSSFYSAREQHTSTALNRPDLDSTKWRFLFTLTTASLADESVTPAKLQGSQGSGFHAKIETATYLGPIIAALSAKSTPVGADKIIISDSAAADASKSVTFTNLWASVFTALGGLINAATGKTTPADADTLVLSDSAASNATKKLTWANVKATLKTYFDTLYAPFSVSGQTLVSFGPLDNEPPSSNYATFDVRNGHPILVFPDAVVYVAIFSGVLPRRYAGGGLTVTINWTSAGTSTNKVCFSATIERMDIGTTDLDADSFGTQVIDTTGIAANATSGIQSQTVIAMTAGSQVDSLAAGEAFRLKITRETGQANDTNTSDAQIVSIEIRET